MSDRIGVAAYLAVSLEGLKPPECRWRCHCQGTQTGRFRLSGG